ncbi:MULTISPECIES: hypothetical protein [unclassified Mammaliicoccus]|uniref:hypothetical protein n=1 Tax=unclassified Mammaliicoccus TaxID=2803851 RepID=UPI001EFB99F4|nr:MULTISPECIES: hypothetical protein [unclassified Mammaliicoccus]
MDDHVYQKIWTKLKDEIDLNIVELKQTEVEKESPGLEKARKMMAHLEDEFIKK